MEPRGYRLHVVPNDRVWLRDSAPTAVIGAVTVPVIASGGAGAPEHFREAFEAGASGALAATVFHDRLIAIPELKEYLATCGIEMRR